MITTRRSHASDFRVQIRSPRAVILVIIFNVRQSYCARYSYRLEVCPSVCLSVTRCRYCVETAQPIVKLSSLPW